MASIEEQIDDLLSESATAKAGLNSAKTAASDDAIAICTVITELVSGLRTETLGDVRDALIDLGYVRSDVHDLLVLRAESKQQKNPSPVGKAFSYTGLG
jgi:hypothetical protein